MHVDSVTGAMLISQSQSGVQLSSNADSTLTRNMSANVGISGYFDPALLGPIPAGLSLLELRDVMLNGQICSLTGIQSLGASSPSPVPGSPSQVWHSCMALPILWPPCVSSTIPLVDEVDHYRPWFMPLCQASDMLSCCITHQYQ